MCDCMRVKSQVFNNFNSDTVVALGVDITIIELQGSTVHKRDCTGWS